METPSPPNREETPPRRPGGLARLLGIAPERKEEIYLQLARAATLRDAFHWLLILFAAGIATLGLVLNSPAVIIGAMLISPLMGPILAAGLALAAGDLLLGAQTGLKLLASCALAVGFAVLLVAALPFKEMTAEIAARTQPTTLDFAIALLSGLVGSVAVCRGGDGVATSIPGVAIAVALMPPLCVAGYGIGYALSLDAAEGLRVAQGGALLFLTNLIAITFTAMTVFLAVRLDTERTRASVRAWRQRDGRSGLPRRLLARVPVLERMAVIGSLPVRVATLVISVALLLVPLSKSFSLLKREIEQHREENRILATGKSVWREMFLRLPDGEPRSFIEHMTVQEAGGGPQLILRVFTSAPCTEAEKDRYIALVTARLHRPPESLSLQLVEIPTAQAALKARRREEPLPLPPPKPSVAKLSGDLERRLSSGLRDLRLPPETEALGCEAAVRPGEPLALTLGYLAGHEIGPDAAALVAGSVRDRLGGGPAMKVALEWCPRSFGPFTFERRRAALTREARSLLDAAGARLEKWPALRAEIVLPGAQPPVMAGKRAQAVREYLATHWRIGSERLTDVTDPARRAITLSLLLPAAARQDGSPTSPP